MRLIIFLVLTLAIASCGKKRTIHITATNGATGVPYQGLRYSIVSSLIGMENGEGTKTVSSGILNENGEAIFTLRESTRRRYAVRVDEPDNCCYNKISTIFFDSPNDKNGHFDFVFAECAYLKQNITNINCQGGGDYMILYTKNHVNSLGATGWEFLGCDGYVGDHFSSVPMGKYYFEWHVTRNSITNIYYDTIDLSPGEYRTYDINY